jgi:predicted aspartyl protease
MGRFEVNVLVANPFEPGRSAQVALLVDTGATLSWIPRQLLEGLGVRPISRSGFLLPDGRHLERDTGFILLTVDGKTMGVPVAFAEEGESQVLGATSLEILGFGEDPVEKKLIPRKLFAL